MTFKDVIIIGSGIAALTAANKLAMDRNVIIFTKSNVTASNSFHAQGGIAAPMHPDDHWKDHFQDTQSAGGMHSDLSNLHILIQKSTSHLYDLITNGLEFDKNENGEWNLGREGGHLKRRILHAGGDATGKALITFMLQQVRNKVTIVENEMVVDLIVAQDRCIGVEVKNTNGRVYSHHASAVIMATGGCGELYAYSSNDATATGDGIAMAYRAGVQLTDMEFIQFHPTLLYNEKKTLGLVSEAVRGEGAFLVNSDGHLIMEGVHELNDLAPRDIVARTILRDILRGKQVYLDISPVKNFQRRFPTIYKLCKESSIALNENLLPVVPGAHFLIGGIKADQDGRTSLNGLYAVGEAACTGVHGANRIASNSLLEGIVFGNLTAQTILAEETRAVDPSMRMEKETMRITLPLKDEIKRRMMREVGVIRNKEGLLRMQKWLEQYDFLHADLTILSNEEIEIVNMLTTAWLITTSAFMRTESRGTHFRTDYPLPNGSRSRQEITRQREVNVPV
ncbi:L-aspartate oxidase [Virgibacillus flavescens]|uniref:L-aspartate oxidase n=1 Tax=Virgibacillus flavescens TaxID=1611422 RepID=UPI003D3560F9